MLFASSAPNRKKWSTNRLGRSPKKRSHTPARMYVPRLACSMLSSGNTTYILSPCHQTVPIVPHPSAKHIYAQWALKNLWINSRTSRLGFMESLWQRISEVVQNVVFVD